MKLIVNGSSSAGNNYLFVSNSGEILGIEAGVSLKEMMKSIDFDYKSLLGILITHEHGDHAKHAKKFLEAKIDLYSSLGTLLALGIESHLAHPIKKTLFKVGSFTILPFGIIHDAADPLGFLIHHPEMGNTVFLTDTNYSPFKFKNINHAVIECNYADDILEDNLMNGALHPSVVDRVKMSHMELSITKDLLLANDLSQLQNIVLIHLSSQNSDEKRFQKEITELTGKKVTVARKGISIELNRHPF